MSNTAEIRGLKIISEQGIASGIRRIEAVAGDAFIDYINVRDNHMRRLCSTLKVYHLLGFCRFINLILRVLFSFLCKKLKIFSAKHLIIYSHPEFLKCLGEKLSIQVFPFTGLADPCKRSRTHIL